MKDTMTGSAPMMLASLALALSASLQPAAAGNLCDYASARYAPLDPADFAGCVKLRTKGIAAPASPTVWSLTDQSVFATTCPVTVAVPAPHPTECKEIAKEALKTGDVVRVNEWGPDRLELAILRDGQSVFHPSRPRVFLDPATATIDGDTHTIGYFADALVYADASRTGKAVPARYYVYLADMVQDGATIRWYQVEVFDDSKKCREEIPGNPAAGTEVVKCDLGAGSAPVRLRGQGVKQLPTGGGGEPPIRP